MKSCRPFVFFFALGSCLLAGSFLFRCTASETNPIWFHRVWQADDGLPANSVSGVVQTPDGRLWVSTHNGLAKFDGVKFYKVALPIPSGRIHPLIRSMLLGARGDVWLALEGGIVVQIKDSVTRVFTSTNGLPLFRPLTLGQSGDGAVWVSYVDGSACRIFEGKVTRFTARDGLSGVGPCVLAGDLSGNIWFAKAGQVGVFRDGQFRPLFDLPTGTLRLASARGGGVWICSGLQLFRCLSETNAPQPIGNVPSLRSGVEPSTLFEDREGTLWVGTLGDGLFLFDGRAFSRVSTSHQDVLGIAYDREANVWAGTDGGGLNRLRPRLLELQDAEDGLPPSTIRSICEDSTQTMWAVTQSGEVTRLIQGKWRPLSAADGWPGVKATCAIANRTGDVWLGTYHAGLIHWNGKTWSTIDRNAGLGGAVVRALFLDSKTNLWLGLESSTCVQRLRGGTFETFAQPPASRAVRALAEDAQGNVWFGTLDGFLLRADGDHLINETSRTLSPSKPIRALMATADGSLWIAYAGAGLGRLKDGRFTHLSTAHGIPDAYICALTADDGGGWWFSSDHGIFQLRQREIESVIMGTSSTLRAVTYGRDEGLPNLQANYGYAPGFARSRDGKIWFPMRTGLAVVHPERTRPNRVPPPVSIEQVAVDNHTVNYVKGKLLRLPPGHRKVEIDYTAFSFIAPEHVTFRRRLEGWEEEWADVGAERRATYSRLPAGDYTFHVASRSSVGEWNPNSAALTFSVEPFIWQTWWFQVASLIAFTLVVVAVVRFASFRRLRLRLQRLEKEAAVQKERSRIAKDIHDDLGATLTQISLLTKLGQHDLDEREKLNDHLKHISKAAREGVKAVDEIVWAVNPRNDTLPHLLDYAGQFAVDFLRATHIRCRVDFPADVPSCVLTADVRHSLFLAVKEALNNVVKHSAASEVWIRAEVVADSLKLSIEDNGKGFAVAGDTALADGLRNIRQRLAEIGGLCEIISTPGGGTKVFLELKLLECFPRQTAHLQT